MANTQIRIPCTIMPFKRHNQVLLPKQWKQSRISMPKRKNSSQRQTPILASIFGSFLTDLKMALVQRFMHFKPRVIVNLPQKNIQAFIITPNLWEVIILHIYNVRLGLWIWESLSHQVHSNKAVRNFSYSLGNPIIFVLGNSWKSCAKIAVVLDETFTIGERSKSTPWMEPRTWLVTDLDIIHRCYMLRAFGPSICSPSSWFWVVRTSVGSS